MVLGNKPPILRSAEYEGQLHRYRFPVQVSEADGSESADKVLGQLTGLANLKAGRDAGRQCCVVPEDFVAPSEKIRSEPLEEGIGREEFSDIFGPVAVEGQFPEKQRFRQDAGRAYICHSTDDSPFQGVRSCPALDLGTFQAVPMCCVLSGYWFC